LDFTFLGIQNFSGLVGTLYEGFGNLRAHSGSNPELGPPGALGRGLATRWGAAWPRAGARWGAAWTRLGRGLDAPGPRPGRAWAASGTRLGRDFQNFSGQFLGFFEGFKYDLQGLLLDSKS